MSDLPAKIAVDFSATLDPYFADLFGDAEGYVAVSYGRVPHTPTFYAWPAEKDKLLADAARENLRTNVFFCPALRQTKDVAPIDENTGKGGGLSADVNKPVEPMRCLWLDVDYTTDDGEPKPVDQVLHRRLVTKGAWRARSGRNAVIEGRAVWNEHDILPLVDGMTLSEFQRLNTGLKNAVGADHAQSHAKWLRLPTFTTYKPGLPHPREVSIFAAPTERWAVADLEALISPQGSRRASPKRRQGTGARGRQASTEAGVRRLLRRRYANATEGELSEAFHHAVVQGVEDRVPLDRLEELLTGHVVAERFEREGRLRGEIKRSAEKATPRPIADTAQRNQTSWTLGELMKQEFPELTWAVDGLVPEGLTLLVAAPKIGKSFLTMCLALSLVFGQKALGSLDGDAGDVLVIPLDDPSPRRMQTRLREIMQAAGMRPGDSKHELYLEADWPTLAEGGGDQLDEWLENHPNCSLVVIDTLSRLRDEEARKSADPGKPDEKAMAEFKRIADKHRVAIIGTHHDRKGESEDFVDMVSGNKKLTGGADTVIYLKRARGEGTTVAHITGRDVEERQVALQFAHPLWSVSDRTPAELGMGELRLDIVDYLREHGEASIKQVAAGLGKPYATVQQRMFQMKNASEIEQDGPRQPYRLPRA